jgi:hypothetical protein
MESTYYEVLRDLVFRSLQKETRLSEHQLAQLKWSQISGNVISTRYKRQVEVSRELERALSLLPHNDPRGYVFIGASLLVRQSSPEMDELRARFEAEAEAKRPKKVRFIQINWGARRLTKAE